MYRHLKYNEQSPCSWLTGFQFTLLQIIFMRQENLGRLDKPDVKSKHPHYIHYYFLLQDIREAI